MSDVTLPTPDDVAQMRERHVRDRAGLTTCGTCPQTWPCDAARLLALVDSLTQRMQHLENVFVQQDDRLAAVLVAVNNPHAIERLTLDRIRRAATGEGS